jgi:hypothetical protein
MELFPFIEKMFNPESFRKIDKSIKDKHYFIVMRFLSIKYPLEVNKFNLLKINKSNVLDYFSFVLSKQYSRTPNWFRVATNKDSQKSLLKDIDKNIICQYIRMNELDSYTFNELSSENPEFLLSELKKLKKFLKDNN